MKGAQAGELKQARTHLRAFHHTHYSTYSVITVLSICYQNTDSILSTLGTLRQERAILVYEFKNNKALKLYNRAAPRLYFIEILAEANLVYK